MHAIFIQEFFLIWEDISYELNVSYRTVHRIHASSLNNFVVPE